MSSLHQFRTILLCSIGAIVPLGTAQAEEAA